MIRDYKCKEEMSLRKSSTNMFNISFLLAFFFAIIGTTVFSQGHLDSTYRNYAPVISPDGKTVAYYAKIRGNWDLYTVDIEGKNKNRLTDHPGFDGEPAWSPDGKKIVFTSDRDGDNEIFIVDLQSLKIEQITHNSISDNRPVFSLDGITIFYRSKVGSQMYIFSIRLDESKGRILSDINVEGRIRLSTEGKCLSFVTSYQNSYALCRIDTDGNPLSMTFTKFDYPGNPHYSDSEARFIFDAHKEGSDSSGDGKWELWTIEPNGSNLQQITNNKYDDWGATWSKDSKSLVYAGKGLNNTGYEIFYLMVDQQNARQLTIRK